MINLKQQYITQVYSPETMFQISQQINIMKEIQQQALQSYGVDDIWSNSKVYEIIIANCCDHDLIPGHSGSKDARNHLGEEFEYKHFKESSSNHTWTFNDFSDSTIASLKNVKSVIFAHIEDVKTSYPGCLDWYYEVPGSVMSNFLEMKTPSITNSRKMINISCKQLENLGFSKTYVSPLPNRKYTGILEDIDNLAKKLELLTGVKNLLTSNKFWELLVALKLNHTVNSEQGGRAGAHDAYDDHNRPYEYKVSKTHSWNFQDISDNVLNKYYDDYLIILAVVDKTAIEVTDIYAASPKQVVPLLREKLNAKIAKKATQGEELRRLQVSLSKSDLKRINAHKIF